MASEWRAVDLWQHMRWVVEDERGAEVAACFGENAQAHAEQIVADHNNAASLQQQLDAERERSAGLVEALRAARRWRRDDPPKFLWDAWERDRELVDAALAAPAERRGGTDPSPPPISSRPGALEIVEVREGTPGVYTEDTERRGREA